MPDESLCFTAPVQDIPHGRRRSDHGAGSIDSITSALKDSRTGGRTERLAGDRHPTLAVEWGFFRALLRDGE
jgi:hypothetical protein